MGKKPPSKQEILELEPYTGLGLEQVRLICSAEEAQQALAEMGAHEALGFDTESRPTFVKNQRSGGPHVLQFATPERAYIFQSHHRECHPAIAEVLKSDHIAKIGFGLSNDIRHIGDRFGIEPQAIVDLDRAFMDLGYKNQVGARTAIAILFNKRFAKSKSTTTSDWSNKVLSEKQLLYAANDAYAAIQVYRALKKRPPPAGPTR